MGYNKHYVFSYQDFSDMDYKKMFLDLLAADKIKDLPLTSEVMEDNELVSFILKHNPRLFNGSRYALNCLYEKGSEFFMPWLKANIAYNTFDIFIKNVIEMVPNIATNTDYANLIIDKNPALIQLFPELQSKPFIIKRLEEGKSVSLNLLPQFCHDKDIAQACAKGGVRTDMTWIAHSVRNRSDILMARAGTPELAPDAVEEVLMFGANPDMLTQREFYWQAIFNYPPVILSIPMEILESLDSLDIWAKHFLQSFKTQSSDFKENNLSYILGNLPVFVLGNNEELYQWLEELKKTPRLAFSHSGSYSKRLLERASEHNSLFHDFLLSGWGHTFSQAFGEHIKQAKTNMSYTWNDLLFQQIEELPAQFFHFKIELSLSEKMDTKPRIKI